MVQQLTDRELTKQIKQSGNTMKGIIPKDEFTDEEGSESINPEELLGKPKVQLLDENTVKNIYPVRVSNTIIKRVTQAINDCLTGSEDGMEYFLRDNIIGLIDVMKDNKTNSFEEYLNAVKFVTFKQAGDSNLRAYSRTFPDTVYRLHAENKPKEHLYAYANAFAKTKLVTKIQAMMMIPSHIMYQDVFHQAVKVQAEIMNDDQVSPKVRSDAANSLMTHLKQPEVKQMELSVNTKDDGAIASLTEALNALSGSQRDMMLSGKYTSKELREATIIEVEENE